MGHIYLHLSIPCLFSWHFELVSTSLILPHYHPNSTSRYS